MEHDLPLFGHYLGKITQSLSSSDKLSTLDLCLCGEKYISFSSSCEKSRLGGLTSAIKIEIIRWFVIQNEETQVHEKSTELLQRAIMMHLLLVAGADPPVSSAEHGWVQRSWMLRGDPTNMKFPMHCCAAGVQR